MKKVIVLLIALAACLTLTGGVASASQVRPQLTDPGTSACTGPQVVYVLAGVGADCLSGAGNSVTYPGNTNMNSILDYDGLRVWVYTTTNESPGYCFDHGQVYNTDDSSVPDVTKILIGATGSGQCNGAGPDSTAYPQCPAEGDFVAWETSGAPNGWQPDCQSVNNNTATLNEELDGGVAGQTTPLFINASPQYVCVQPTSPTWTDYFNQNVLIVPTSTRDDDAGRFVGVNAYFEC